MSVARALSADEGRVTIDDLSAGRYVIVATVVGMARASAVEELSEGSARDVRLVTGPEATIAGVLRQDLGRRSEPSPLRGVVVRVVPDGGGSEPAFAARTGDDGSYVVRGLRAGTYRVEIDDERFEPIVRRAVPAPSRAVDLLARAFAGVTCVVRDERGAPVRDARVSIAGSGVWPARAESTSDDGVARLTRLPSGVYELRAQLGSRVAEPVAPLLLDPGEARAVTMTLGEGAAIEGRVVDARSGAPIVDARIIVAEDALSAAPRALLSEHDGAFRLGGLLRRPHVLSARAPGFVPRVGEPCTPGGQPVTIALDREVLVRGRVVDSRGAPVANAQVELTATDLDGRTVYLNGTARAFREQLFERQQRGPTSLRPTGELGVTSGRVPHIPTDPFVPTSPTPSAGDASADSGFVTDAQGRFRIGEVSPGAVRVTATHPLYVRAESELRAARAGETIDVEVVLHAGGVIDGRLVDERGFPVGQQMIEARIDRDPVPRRVFTARDGAFRIASVLGRASVVAVVGGRAAARAEVDVADDQVARVQLVLDANTRRVRGRVVDREGYPIAGSELLLAGGGHSARGVSSPDGTFDLVLVGRGSFSIEARHPRYAPRLLTVHELRDELRIALEPGATVTARVDGRSCARGDVEVSLSTACGVLQRTIRAEGEARFEQVCPGRVELAASAPGCIRQVAASVVVRSGARIELARTELVAGGGAEGEVVDGRGEQVAGALVTLADADAQDLVLARSDRRGSFRAESVAEGEQRVVATHPVLGRSEVAVVRILRGTIARGLRLRFARALEGASAQRSTRWLSLVEREGALVVERVDEGSPGHRVGLRRDDRIVAIDGRTPGSATSAEQRVTNGEECVLEVARDGARRLLRVLP